jgi:hypothetical protein
VAGDIAGGKAQPALPMLTVLPALHEMLANFTALSNENKEIIERYSYDVFGQPNRTSDVNLRIPLAR